MKKPDLVYICTAIGNLSGIPVRLYREGALAFFHALVSLPKDPIASYAEQIASIGTSVGYFVTKQLSCYGVINTAEVKIVIGPTRQVPLSEAELRVLAFQTGVAKEDTEDFIAGMKGIVRMPLESLLQLLCVVNYILNDEKLEIMDIEIYGEEQENLRAYFELQKDTPVYRDAGSGSTKEDLYNSFALEQRLLDMVRKGDVASLSEWIRTAPGVRGGTLASDQLRQMKNTFIVSATLSARAAIRGGMDVGDAFPLSDVFIQRMELLNSMERLVNLQYHMVLEFTERVARIRRGSNPTKLTTEVSNYIQHHLSEPIRVEAIARALFLSRPYLSAKFREETGQTLTDFILCEKAEEAKRLLRYTDKTPAAIAVYLGFSSQSHFSRVFKKYAAQTPVEFREKHR